VVPDVASRELAALPARCQRARAVDARHERELRACQAAGRPAAHSQAFAGDPDGTPAERAEFNTSRLNFLALMFCLMVGTASLPHLLTRFYTTPSVAERAPLGGLVAVVHRLLYLSAPALAVLVKYEVMQHLVGSSFDALPNWIAQWARVDPR
jgi:cation/acetate symporter